MVTQRRISDIKFLRKSVKIKSINEAVPYLLPFIMESFPKPILAPVGREFSSPVVKLQHQWCCSCALLCLILLQSTAEEPLLIR